MCNKIKCTQCLLNLSFKLYTSKKHWANIQGALCIYCQEVWYYHTLNFPIQYSTYKAYTSPRWSISSTTKKKKNEIQPAGMWTHSLLFKHSEAAALIFACKVLLQWDCAQPVTVYSAMRREWGWAGLWG